MFQFFSSILHPENRVNLGMISQTKGMKMESHILWEALLIRFGLPQSKQAFSMPPRSCIDKWYRRDGHFPAQWDPKLGIHVT